MDENMMDKIQEVLSDPESMQQIAELAQMFQSSSGSGNAAPSESIASSAPPALPGGDGLPFDPGMLMKMGELMRNSGGSDKNTALLMALRPHLGEQRQQRIDKALRLLKLWTVFQTMQKTGMLQQLL